MAIVDANLQFTSLGTAGFAPTVAGDNIAPFTIDTSPLGLPTGSGGSSTPGYGAGVNVNAGRDLGIGGEMWLQVLVTVAVAQAANNAIFKLVTDNTATITTVNVLLSSPAFTAAQLIAGSYFRAQLPASGSYLQYLGLNVNIVTTNWTAGTVEGILVQNVQQSDLYLNGFFVQ